MMSNNTFDAVLPVPSEIRKADGAFPLASLRTFCIKAGYPVLALELGHIAGHFALDLVPASEDGAALLIAEDKSLEAEEWRMTVSAGRICIAGGGKRALLYGVSALTQMLAAALIKGHKSPIAQLDCGEICDRPRFGWRGFMLDCARHYQSKAMMKNFIHIMSALRLNSLHWHLTDNQSWRIASEILPELVNGGEFNEGYYSREDLREIADYAELYGIRIIPEIDVPGHSRHLLKACPQYTCCGEGDEFCIGNPESKALLKKIFSELMAIFPGSPIIHLGGDEAETDHWSACPKCRAAMESGGFKTMRELENAFMCELTQFVAANGRTPMLWGTGSGQVYPENTVIQVWLTIQEPYRVSKNGNKVVFSVHNSLYFDYPANLAEPHETWMFSLTEQSLYMTEPYIIWEDELRDALLGTEACMWTEKIPEWRLFAKLFPRIYAYAECAWSKTEKKEWHSYCRRKELLENAGYGDFLRRGTDF